MAPVTRLSIRLAPATLGLVVLATLASCGTADDPSSGTPSGAPDSFGSLTDEPAEPTQKQVRAAQRELVRADTGQFASTFEVPGLTQRRTGSYQLHPPAFEATQENIQDAAPDVTNESVVVDGVTYVRLSEDGAASRCWFGTAAQVKPDGSRSGVGLPPEVLVVLLARGSRSGETTSDLYSTASLVGSRLSAAMQLDPDVDARTRVSLELAGDDATTYWSTDLADLVAASAAIGNSVSADMSALSSGSSSISAALTELGEPVEIVAPPADLVVPLTGDDVADDAAYQACNDG
ncbi:hypothetical protein BH11ACT8_BH11ACT8_09470 [soil metagenome]